MRRMRRSVRALLSAALLVVAATVLLVLSATRLSGDTAGMSLPIAAAAASALSAFGFLLQWRKGRHQEEPGNYIGLRTDMVQPSLLMFMPAQVSPRNAPPKP